ncbi:photosynthetic complex putative assembly protein PuhB [Thalassobaculum salexigens]|uniref:photosynthetic complex putative assembly protein PuhB n=1 Tax=Thalassobaculum salexigens TaxID=455360 RepID=UPI0003FC9493|nr:photosynthetic complex putative assembly protein PuhB [Thalassobaculum salexigens]
MSNSAVIFGEFDDSRPVTDAPAAMAGDERIVWQGAPDWRRFALSVMKLRTIALYFAVIMAARFAADLVAGQGAGAGLISAAWTLCLAAPVLAFLALYARLVARSTRYTVTTRRIVLRIGVAMPMTVTVPVGLVDTIDLRRNADGSGDILIGVLPEQRLSYSVLWPHARPWCFSRPQAALRAVPDAEAVAETIGRMLARQTTKAPAQESVQGSAAKAPARDTGSVAAAAG